MAELTHNYIQSNVSYTVKDKNLPQKYLGTYIGATDYEYDDNGNIVSNVPFINVFDIDWNDMTIAGVSGSINTTSDLANLLKNFSDTVSNVSEILESKADRGELNKYAIADDLLEYIRTNYINGLASKSDLDEYSKTDHQHSTYALSNHSHNTYSLINHRHDEYFDESVLDAKFVDLKDDIMETIPTIHISYANVDGLESRYVQKNSPEMQERAKSAYDIAVSNGFVGSEQEWLQSLKGADGLSGSNGKDGKNGIDGQSAYDIAVSATGYEGTQAEWIESLKGSDGEKGEKGDQGPAGARGRGISIAGSFPKYEDLVAAYPYGPGEDSDDCYIIGNDLYVWDVNLVEWKNVGKIKGEDGEKGLSAYEIAIEENEIDTTVTKAQWLASLHGKSAYEIAQVTYEQIFHEEFPYASEADWVRAMEQRQNLSAGTNISIDSNKINLDIKWGKI